MESLPSRMLSQGLIVSTMTFLGLNLVIHATICDLHKSQSMIHLLIPPKPSLQRPQVPVMSNTSSSRPQKILFVRIAGISPSFSLLSKTHPEPSRKIHNADLDAWEEKYSMWCTYIYTARSGTSTLHAHLDHWHIHKCLELVEACNWPIWLNSVKKAMLIGYSSPKCTKWWLRAEHLRVSIHKHLQGIPIVDTLYLPSQRRSFTGNSLPSLWPTTRCVYSNFFDH